VATPYLPDCPIDGPVDSALVPGTTLRPNLADNQAETHRRCQKAFDQRELIAGWQGLRPAQHHVQVCAACRHLMRRYHNRSYPATSLGLRALDHVASLWVG